MEARGFKWEPGFFNVILAAVSAFCFGYAYGKEQTLTAMQITELKGARRAIRDRKTTKKRL